MADWHSLHLTFDPPARPEVLDAWKAELKEHDYDAPVDRIGVGGSLELPYSSYTAVVEGEHHCLWRGPLVGTSELVAMLERRGLNGHGWLLYLAGRSIHDVWNISDVDRFTFGVAPAMRDRIDYARRIRDADVAVRRAQDELIEAARAGGDLTAAAARLCAADLALAILESKEA